MSEPLSVGLLIYPNVELLDFAGPGEVFAAAGDAKAFTVHTVAESKEPLISQDFLTVTPEYGINDDFYPDIVMVPGGNSEWLIQSEPVLAWIDEAVNRASYVLSVCTGSLALAKLGHLDGLTATTHHTAMDTLRKMAPNTTVIDTHRVVDNGKIVVTAGVSAGIDGAMHLVSKLLGPEEAKRTAEYIELHRNADVLAP